VALLTLFVLPVIEKIIRSDWYATLMITCTLETLPEDHLKSRIETFGPIVKTMRLSYDLEKKQKTITCELKLKKPVVFQWSSKVMADLALCPGVLRIRWA